MTTAEARILEELGHVRARLDELELRSSAIETRLELVEIEGHATHEASAKGLAILVELHALASNMALMASKMSAAGPGGLLKMLASLTG